MVYRVILFRFLLFKHISYFTIEPKILRVGHRLGMLFRVGCVARAGTNNCGFRNPDSPAVPQLEAEIDRLVFELYGLTEEEIALVEGKR